MYSSSNKTHEMDVLNISFFWGLTRENAQYAQFNQRPLESILGYMFLGIFSRADLCTNRHTSTSTGRGEIMRGQVSVGRKSTLGSHFSQRGP